MKRKKKKKKLEKKQRLFIIVGSVLLVVFALSVYASHQLDSFFKAWNSAGFPLAGTGPAGPRAPDSKDPEKPEYPEGNSWSFEKGPAEGGDTEGELPSFQGIAREVEARVDRPVDKTDLMRVGLILVRRLDRSEINYLYNVGKKGSYTAAEVAKTREILTKLTPRDRKVLEEMAEKYDQPLFLLK